MPLLKSNNQREQHREIVDGGNHTYGGTAANYPQDTAYGGTEHDDFNHHGTTLPSSGPGQYSQEYSQHHPGYTENANRVPPFRGQGAEPTHYNNAHPGIHQGAAIPPATAISHGGGQDHSTTSGRTGGGGAGQRLTGKIESAIGSAIGSQSLKAKGMEKQYEAEALKLQGAELNEAERLENEARIRRERAVAHGAHPDNLHPQGAQTGFQGNHTAVGHGQGRQF